MIIDVPDYKLDPPFCFCEWHTEECGCAHCHAHKAHDWREWRVYPECDECLNDMEDWLADNTDYFELKETIPHEHRKSA